MSSRRRTIARLALPTAAVALAFASVQCGLLGAPGDYASGADENEGGSPESSTDRDGNTTLPDGAVVLPDGNVVPPSLGTLALMAGERQPSSPEDDPAWSADAWSGTIAADGRISSWRIEKSAPIIGSFDSAGLVGNTWVMINVGFGIFGGRGTAIQSTSWAPGILGDWRAGRANGAPGGLDEFARVFFGNHLLYVGGTRTVADPDGGPSTTFFTKEAHVANVDVVKNELGVSSGAGQQLVDARSRCGLLVAGTNLYVVGGRAPSGITASVETAKLDIGAGTVQAFAAQPPLVNAGADHKVYLPSLAAAEGYLFVAGGRTNFGGTPTDVVLSAKINADGTLGAWSNVTNLPKALRDFALVGFKGRLYVAGGVGATTRSDEVFTASIGADGKLGAWDDSNTKLPSPRSDFVALAY
ncbi:MAG: hypothetical protein JWP87_628 [Labilithrix sp.]|nr:hypothetical protein [Labilithrix sp.]